MSKEVLRVKFLIFAGPDLSKFPKKYLEQKFSFLQVRTCRNCQKSTWSKMSHFDRSGPVEISKEVLAAKFLIFAGPDLSKFPKRYLQQNFSFLQVRTCRNFQKGTCSKISHFCRSGPVEISKKVLAAKFLIFAGPDLSKFPKKYLQQNFSHLKVRTCQNFQKSTCSKICHFDRSGPVKISKKGLRAKFLIFACPDLSKFPKKYLEQNFLF